MVGLRYVNSLCRVCVGQFLDKKITPTLSGRGYFLFYLGYLVAILLDLNKCADSGFQ